MPEGVPENRPLSRRRRRIKVFGLIGTTLAMTLVACNATPGISKGGGPPTKLPYSGAKPEPWTSVSTLSSDPSKLVSGYLSDQLAAATTMSNGDDKRVDGKEVFDGETLSLSGVTFDKGLGVHASSELVFNMDGTCTRFTASVGVDDSVRAGGKYDAKGLSSLSFKVLTGDNVVLFDSGVMTEKSATQEVGVKLPPGATTLRLLVGDGGNGISYDHGDWAGARVECAAAVSPVSPPATEPALPTTAPSGPPTSTPPTTGIAGSFVDASGTIVVDGQKFFPFGFYGVNWREPFADRLQGLKNIGASGFNTMLAEDISTNEFGSLLDEAERLKVKMLVGFPSLSGDNGLESLNFMLQTVEKYKAKPALLGWSLFDDSDDGRLTFSSLRQLNDSVKAKDPSHITFSTLTGYYTQRRAEKDQWLAASDSSGLQMYPIDPPSDYSYDYGGNPLTESYNVSRDYVEAAERGGKAMIINSQTFRWERPGTRLPSKAELRNMVFGQLFAGAKGIVGFVYSQELFDRKDLWNELVAIKQDISTILDGPILNGRLTRKTSGDAELNYAYWEYQGACYVGVLNTSYTQAKSVNLSLPANCTGAAASPLSRLPNTLRWSGSVLSGSVAASEVEVYRVGTP